MSEAVGESTKTPGEPEDSKPAKVTREFRDADDRLWTVFESLIPRSEWTTADSDTFRAGYGIGWLCFETRDEWRHLRLYPTHWATLADASLIRLWRQARDVIQRAHLGRPIS